MRIYAKLEGHTYMYQFVEGDEDRAVVAVKNNVELGALHPYAGIIIIKMIKDGCNGH